MNLFVETSQAVQWTVRVLRQCSRVSRRVTWATIGSLTAARITRMLAFLLPLKVILLAGSDGVPRYFRFFISPDQRYEWVVGLAAGAIVSYAVTLLLEARSKRLTEEGSTDLLAASGVMSVIANQRGEAQGFYARFTQIASATLFACLGLLGFLALNPMLALSLLGLCVCFYTLTAWAVHGVTVLNRTLFADFIIERLGNYLGILSSIAFLSAFLFILYPLARGDEGNILVAIISVVLLRQMLSAVTHVIKDIVSLTDQRLLIDTLIFPKHQFQISEKKVHRTLRELFGRRERERLIAAELASLTQPGQNFRIQWCDPLLRGTADFTVSLKGGEAPARHLRQRVFSPRVRYMVENEDLLFSHVEREAVWAPPLVRRFIRSEHECLIWEVGDGRVAGKKRLRKLENRFLANLWSLNHRRNC